MIQKWYNPKDDNSKCPKLQYLKQEIIHSVRPAHGLLGEPHHGKSLPVDFPRLLYLRAGGEALHVGSEKTPEARTGEWMSSQREGEGKGKGAGSGTPNMCRCLKPRRMLMAQNVREGKTSLTKHLHSLHIFFLISEPLQSLNTSNL